MNKKKLLSIIALVTLAITVIGIGTVYAAGAIAKNNSIGEEAAIDFAYMDAGVDSKEAKNTKVEFDFEHGQYIYEVEFVADNVKYEYEIKASNGAIIGKDMERIASKSTVNEETSKVTEETTVEVPEETEKPKENQKEEKAGKDTKTNETKKIDDDDDFDDDNDLDDDEDDDDNDLDDDDDDDEREATSNKSKDEKKTSKKNNKNNSEKESVSTKYISVEKAKSIALSDAGVKASKAVFKKAKLEKDDGIYIYEIEFMSGNTEYEYDVDAITGKILESSYEEEEGIAEEDEDDDDDDDDDEEDDDDDDEDDD